MKHKDLIKEVAAYCKEARANASLSQQEVALQGDFCQGSYIAHFENGQINTISTLLIYASFMTPKEWAEIKEIAQRYFYPFNR